MSDAACVPSCSPAPSGTQQDTDILHLIVGSHMAAAFALVMARYQGKVYRLCTAYLRDATLAEDVAQDSLIRVWRALPRYDGRAALSTFIYVIARNRCLTALGRRGGNVSSNEPAVQAEMDRQTAMDIQSGRDLDRSLRQLVEELPDATRRVVTLYYFEEESVPEVSVLLGLPEGTVKTHLFRARQQLRSRLKTLGLDDIATWNH